MFGSRRQKYNRRLQRDGRCCYPYNTVRVVGYPMACTVGNKHKVTFFQMY